MTSERCAKGCEIVEDFVHGDSRTRALTCRTRPIIPHVAFPDVLPYMLYSATTEYAIRALAYMATLPPSERILARDLADATRVPRQFLGKILHRLARHGLLESAKGRGGGFRFARAPESITLGEVVGLIEGPDLLARCVLGFDRCDDSQLCPLHDQWGPFRDRLTDRLHSCTMRELARSLKPKLGAGERSPTR
jgi:Rrf2 family protein